MALSFRLVVILLVPFQLCDTVSVAASQGSPHHNAKHPARVMRRLELTPRGEVMEPPGLLHPLSESSSAGHAEPPPKPSPDNAGADNVNDKDLAGMDISQSLGISQKDYCDYDFPLGRINTNNCTDVNNHSLIMSESACLVAAEFANITTDLPTFRGPGSEPEQHNWENGRPIGCFRSDCSQDPTRGCYFWNGIDLWPQNPQGTPVCSRPKHLNGTFLDGSAPEPTAVCATGYRRVDHEDHCRTFASCLSYAPGNPFTINVHNLTKHDEFPSGCFIHAEDGFVYYNSDMDGRLQQPSQPRGTPVCIVEANTTWESEGSNLPPAPALDGERHIMS